MASALQETKLAIETIHDVIDRLKEQHPGHELLQFADSFDAVEPSVAFCERYGGLRVAKCFRHTEFAKAAMYHNYYSELLAALGESTIVR